jgi:hypothetical protein
VSFRQLKAQIYWPTTDQKVRGSNPCGRTNHEVLRYNFSIMTSSPESQANEEINKIIASKNIKLESIIESPMFYSSRQTITKILTRIKLFEKIREIQGSVVECGVYKADSLLTYFHLSNIFEPFSFTRKIIGFDTFTGFPNVSNNDPEHAKVSYLNNVDFELIQKIVVAQEKNKAIPAINKIELIPGDATLTIPKYVEDNPHLIISLLYLDFDLYEPTKIALQHLLPRVPIGGIVGFDELNQAKWAGETQALNDVLKISKVKLRKFDFDPHVTFFERV